MTSARFGFVICLVSVVLLQIDMASAANENDESPPVVESPTAVPLKHKYSGKRFLLKGINFRNGYVLGSLDGFLLAEYLYTTGEQLSDFRRCMDNWSQNQLVAILQKYMHENQGEKSLSAAQLLHEALKADCERPTTPVD